MSKVEDLIGKEAGQRWIYTTEPTSLETKKIIEQNEQIIAELKSISANMNRIATIIHSRFGELEQPQ